MSSGLLLRAVGKTVPLLWCPRSIRDTAQPFHSHPILLLPSRTEICSLLVPGAFCPSVLPHLGVCPCITAQTPPSLFPALALEIISLSISCYCSVFSGSSSSGGCSSPTLSKQLTNSLPGSNIFKMLIRMFILSSAKL